MRFISACSIEVLLAYFMNLTCRFFRLTPRTNVARTTELPDLRKPVRFSNASATATV